MLLWVLIGVAALLLTLLIVLAVFVLGMRTKSPAVLNAVRRFNRAIGNPFQMRSAGTPGAYASVIRHTGRSSGKNYETPLVPFPTDDGFVIALPYGTGTDWLKNVLSAGSATIVYEGNTYMVDQPAIIATEEARRWLPAKEQGSLDRFRVKQCLHMQRVGREDAKELAG